MSFEFQDSQETCLKTKHLSPVKKKKSKNKIKIYNQIHCALCYGPHRRESEGGRPPRGEQELGG